MNTKNLVTMGLALGALSAVANPSIKENSVVLSQNGTNRVTIEYELENAPAIITVDIKTNNVSIGGRYLQFMGDVNKLVQTGPHKVTWLPHKVWPGEDVQNVTAEVTAWSTNTPPDYMVVPLTSSEGVSYYVEASQIPNGGVTNDLYKTEYMVFRKIPAAGVRWRMGTPASERSTYTSDGPAHEVTLSEDFYLGIFEMTQRQYELLSWGTKPSQFKNESYYMTRPVEQVSWQAARGAGFSWPTNGHDIAKSTAMGHMRDIVGAGWEFDLPLEAEWEFACRAGSGSPIYTDETFNRENVEKIARISTNGGLFGGSTYPNSQCDTNNATAAVGSYQPNVWGLYDMHGNVSEWCLDGACGDDVATVDPERGADANKDSNRVARGGNFNNTYTIDRAAYRVEKSPTTQGGNQGLRVRCQAIAFK